MGIRKTNFSILAVVFSTEVCDSSFFVPYCLVYIKDHSPKKALPCTLSFQWAVQGPTLQILHVKNKQPKLTRKCRHASILVSNKLWVLYLFLVLGTESRIFAFEFFISYFETGSKLPRLETIALLPWLPECWDYKQTPPHLARCSIL